MSKKYIKSPLNYVGGKYKLLPQIEPLFANTKIFVDVFGGGANVAVNSNADKVVYNEICPNVFGVIKGIKDGVDNVECLLNIVNKYKLSKTNEEGFKSLRDDYNAGDKSWQNLYMLVCHSFNYQFRFNQSGGYNMPFGRDRSCFSETLQKKYLDFENRIKNMNISLFNKDFRELLGSSKINGDYFFYCDPPYLITTAAYNENGGWTEKDEIDLLNNLDFVDKKGGKFALSNVIKHKGNLNSILDSWSKKYKVHILNYGYKNCSYQGKDTDKETIEVLITNY